MGPFARNNDDQTFATDAAQLRQRRLKITDVLQRMRGYHRIETAIFERQGFRAAFVKPDGTGGGLERIDDDDVDRGDVMVFGQPLAEKAVAATDLQHRSTDHGVLDRRNAFLVQIGLPLQRRCLDVFIRMPERFLIHVIDLQMKVQIDWRLLGI